MADLLNIGLQEAQGGGGDQKGKGGRPLPSVLPWSNARIPSNSTIFSEQLRNGQQIQPVASPGAVRESTMTRDTIPATESTRDQRGVTGGGVPSRMQEGVPMPKIVGSNLPPFDYPQREYPDYNPAIHAQAAERALRSAIQDPQGRGQVAPIDQIYQFYGEDATRILDALDKLATVNGPDGRPLGGTMSAVDLTKPVKFTHTKEMDDRGMYNAADGTVKIHTYSAINPGVASRHTLGHEVLHSIKPWADYNWPGNPYEEHLTSLSTPHDDVAENAFSNKRILRKKQRLHTPAQVASLTR
ncbi:MAG: hypothetical protein RBU27_05455 [Bacteroidota bacterium]|nr:hypothetical protein [Bacteroidota bacterium]